MMKPCLFVLDFQIAPAALSKHLPLVLLTAVMCHLINCTEASLQIQLFTGKCWQFWLVNVIVISCLFLFLKMSFYIPAISEVI